MMADNDDDDDDERQPLVRSQEAASRARRARMIGLLVTASAALGGACLMYYAARRPSRSDGQPAVFKQADSSTTLVRESCVNNDDDNKFATMCPKFDEESWCSRPDRSGPGTAFHEVCADACADPRRAYAMVCAWEAVANMRSVCAGTFKPTPPTRSANRPNTWGAPLVGVEESGAVLWPCDEHAVCYACFSGESKSPGGGEMCERVAAHYGGFGIVDDREFVFTGAEAAFRAIADKDDWCAELGYP